MNIKFPTLRLASGALLCLLPLFPAAASAVDVDSLQNVLVISGGGAADFKGDSAAFQKRYQINPDGYGGIELLRYSATSDKGTLSIEGRALAGNNDYLLSFKFANDERGWLSFGYREYRTWYDGSGSTVPLAATRPNGRPFFSLYDEVLATDRVTAWVEGLFKGSERVDLHFKYTHNEREGMKDSTSQGDTNLTGGLGGRRIVPAFYTLDESQNLFEVDATARLENMELGAAVRWDNRKVDNSRNMRRRPTETGTDRYVTQWERNDSDLFNARGYIRQQYNEKLAFNAAYSHTKVDTVLGGSRIVGMTYDANWDPLFANRQARDEGFFDLSGESETKLDVANINMVYTPTEHFAVVPSFRVEKETREVVADFEETNFSTARVATVHGLEDLSERKWDEWVLGLESRYTGIKKWSFVARATLTEGDGEIDEDRVDHSHVSLINRDTLVSKWTEKYALTANWYPARKANFAFIYTFWNRYTDYDTASTSVNSSVTSGDRYPAYIKSTDYTTNDFAVRMTLRPATNVTLVSRYDIQKTEVDVNQIGLHLIEAAEYDSRIFSQSVNWNPSNKVFVQGMINYVEDTLLTPANSITGAGANLVLGQVNDYWSSSLSLGVAVDERTDVSFQYNYFFADNFVDNSTVSVPYGLDRKDQSFNATWTRRITDQTKISLRYAWAQNDEDSAVGLNDFEAHLLYAKVEYRF
jgi:hypothetical protein